MANESLLNRSKKNQRVNYVIYFLFLSLTIWAIGIAGWKYLIKQDFLVTTTADRSITYNFATDQETLAPMIEACQWGETKYLIFSTNVFPSMVYSFHLIPLILIGFLGIFILSHNNRSTKNKIFFVAATLFCFWIFLDMILWASPNASNIMFFWTLLVYLEPLIFLTFWYLLYQYSHDDLPAPFWTLPILTLLIPNLLFGHTGVGLSVFDLADCEREAIEGPLLYYNYIVDAIFTFAAVALVFINKNKLSAEKNGADIKLTAFGVSAFLLLFPLGLLFGTITRDWAIAGYGLIGAPIFFSIIAYSMIRYRSFQIKIAGIIALIFAIWGFIVSIAFVEQLNLMYYVTAGSLLIAGLFGIFADTKWKR